MCAHEHWEVIGGSFDSDDGVIFTPTRRLVECRDCGMLAWDDELTPEQRAVIEDDLAPKGFGTTSDGVYYDTLRND